MAEASAELPLTTDEPIPSQLLEGVSQPLDPRILQDMPLGSFGDQLSAERGHACDAWYNLVEKRADAHLRPPFVHRETERAFAFLMARVVREGVLDAARPKHEVFNPEKVTDEITAYYTAFRPSLRASPEQIAHQNVMIRRARDVRNESGERFMEFGVLVGLQRAFIVRGQQHPSRATFAVLSAYGAVATSRLSQQEAAK